MAGIDQPDGPGKLRRFWQNLWGQDPDLRLETRWQKFMALWGLHVPPPGRHDRLHIRPRFFKVIGVFAVSIPLFLAGAAFKGARPRSSALEHAEATLAAAKRARRDVATASELLGRARKDFDFIAKAKGLHNPDLAEAILTESKNTAERVTGMLKK